MYSSPLIKATSGQPSAIQMWLRRAHWFLLAAIMVRLLWIAYEATIIKE